MDSKTCDHDHQVRLHVVAVIGPVVGSLASRIQLVTLGNEIWTSIPIGHIAYTTDGSEIC